jgi:hypothetical protein
MSSPTEPMTPTHPQAPEESPWVLAPEDLPDVEGLVIEDGQPVDNIFAEKQYRLLTEPLYSSWAGPGEGRTFLALANVGLFFADKQPPLAPDVMLSLDVPPAADLSQKENRSYLIWVKGKPPDVAIEFVSDRRGGEDSFKMSDYARIRVLYYVIFDPRRVLSQELVRAFELRDGAYVRRDPSWLPAVQLGLTLWDGEYERQPGQWLRWREQDGSLIPTGRERAEQERQRADQEQQRAEKLAAQLRAAGIEPEM